MTFLEWTTAIGPQTKYSDPSPTGKYMPARGDKQKTFTGENQNSRVSCCMRVLYRRNPNLTAEGNTLGSE